MNNKNIIKNNPKFVIGAFILNKKGEMLLRTTPSQQDKYTCINSSIEWGDTILKTLEKNVKSKTNLDIESVSLIGLTDGLNIEGKNKNELVHMVFADYRVYIKDSSLLKEEEGRKYKWQKPKDWIKEDENIFGPYILEIVKKLVY